MSNALMVDGQGELAFLTQTQEERRMDFDEDNESYIGIIVDRVERVMKVGERFTWESVTKDCFGLKIPSKDSIEWSLHVAKRLKIKNAVNAYARSMGARWQLYLVENDIQADETDNSRRVVRFEDANMVNKEIVHGIQKTASSLKRYSRNLEEVLELHGLSSRDRKAMKQLIQYSNAMKLVAISSINSLTSLPNRTKRELIAFFDIDLMGDE